MEKKLYCTFVDFRKAFDTVWRCGLWQKLLKSNVTGKIFKVIVNIYNASKSCVKNGNELSDFFVCNVGVKQGENLSPFLFSIYLNDLEEFFIENDVSELNRVTTLCRDHIETYVKLLVLLYADDTIIFSETPDGLQKAMNVFKEYCTLWKLKVNTTKTKVVIFSKRKSRTRPRFTFNGAELEVQDSYTYLGLTFNYNGSFVKARKKLVDQAKKALYALYKKLRNISLPVDLQLKLFDMLVMPILLYAVEVWGFEKLDLLEKVHLQFCKNILNVRKSTPNYMVYGELGRFPVEIIVKKRLVMFWYKLITGGNKLSSKIYKLIFKLQESGNFKWLKRIKSIFDDTGLSFIWLRQENCTVDRTWLKSVLTRRLQDQFIQTWFQEICDSSKGQFYAIFKQEFKLEKYLLSLSRKDSGFLCKFRTSNLKLPIEVGRWHGIPREDRLCPLCNSGIGDEMHYLYNCTNNIVGTLRNQYIPEYYRRFPSVMKTKGLMAIFNKTLYCQLCKFIEKFQKLIPH